MKIEPVLRPIVQFPIRNDDPSVIETSVANREGPTWVRLLFEPHNDGLRMTIVKQKHLEIRISDDVDVPPIYQGITVLTSQGILDEPRYGKCSLCDEEFNQDELDANQGLCNCCFADEQVIPENVVGDPV